MASNPVPPVPDTWYAAHLLFRARVVDKPTVFPVVEKVVLLNSASDLAATTEAEGLGPLPEETRRLSQGDARLEFMGVRKVTRMAAPSHGQSPPSSSWKSRRRTTFRRCWSTDR